MSDLRDKRSGACDKVTAEQDVTREDSKLTEHQRGQWGADVREGTPSGNVVAGEDMPEGLRRARKGPYGSTIGRRSVD